MDEGTRSAGNGQTQEIMSAWKTSQLNTADAVKNSRGEGHGSWGEPWK